MGKYRWIKLKDVHGETYEFEDCEMQLTFRKVVIFFVVPIGSVRKTFYKRNLISLETLIDEEPAD